MAGYNRGIVATRKLNKENKARLGRKGDTKIREVDGRDSHVNALEAYLIDVNNKAGEDYAKRVGAGTTNPLTGMPEYHWNLNPLHMGRHAAQKIGELGNKTVQAVDPNEPPEPEYTGLTGRQDYETLSGMSPEQLEAYLKDEFEMGKDKMKYIEGFKEEPFTFLGEQQTLTEERALSQKGLTERGLTSAYGATMGGLESQEAALGRTTGRGLRQATGAASSAASRSGLATSGTITSGLEEQKRGLFQDYTAGTKDVRRERGTALETLTLGQDVAGADYTATVAGADLDFRQSEYIEKKRQLDELYADVGAIPT